MLSECLFCREFTSACQLFISIIVHIILSIFIRMRYHKFYETAVEMIEA